MMLGAQEYLLGEEAVPFGVGNLRGTSTFPEFTITAAPNLRHAMSRVVV